MLPALGTVVSVTTQWGSDTDREKKTKTKNDRKPYWEVEQDERS